MCFSGQIKAATIQFSQLENTFAIRHQLPGSQKHVSLRFQSSVKTFLWNDVPFLEKRCQGIVFYGCWLPYPLLLWLGEILLSDDFPAKSWKHAFYFRKLKIVNKAVVMKNEEVCFSCKFKAATMQLILGEILLLPKVPNSQVYKIMLSCSFRTV